MNSLSFFRLTQFFLIGLTLAVLPLAPVNFIPRTFPSPDFLFCFIIAWHLRDPQSSPLPLILFLTLLVDIVQFRPIGLWPIFMILLSNLITINRRLFFNGSFVKELHERYGFHRVQINATARALACTVPQDPPQRMSQSRCDLVTLASFSASRHLGRSAEGPIEERLCEWAKTMCTGHQRGRHQPPRGASAGTEAGD